MTYEIELKDTDNSINWIEKAINENYFKHYKYEHFNNIQEIGSGSFGKIYRANWKSSNMNFVLKSFLNSNNAIIEEVVREVITSYNIIIYKEYCTHFYNIFFLKKNPI
jgi:serine/threonine protein kinase